MVVVVVMAVTAWSYTGGSLSTASNNSTPSSPALTPDASIQNAPPIVEQAINNTIVESTSNYTDFSTTPGDGIIVFIAIHGRNTVRAVTDNEGDTFTQQVYAFQSTNGGDANNGLAIWSGFDVAGGDTNVTVTMSTYGTDYESNALEFIDVSGFNTENGSVPVVLGSLGTVSNSTYLTGRNGVTGDFQFTNSAIEANSTELILTEVASRNNVTWSPNATASELDIVNTNSTVSGSNLTLMSMSNTTSSTGIVYNNATIYDNSTGTAAVPWISDSLTLYAPDPTTLYKVTFTEKNLPSGTWWGVDFAGNFSSSTTGTLSVSATNAAYLWNVSTRVAYLVNPAGGTITVAGANKGITLTFTNTTKDPIQHVVVIVLENEGDSEVAKYAPYVDYLSKYYANDADYYAACHHSAPNYLGMVAADTEQCSTAPGDDDYHNYTSTTVGDLLTGGKYSWTQFAENLPSDACTKPWANSGSYYVFRHVPYLYFENVSQSSECSSLVKSSSSFESSSPGGIRSTSFVNYSFYSPNICDDGHKACNLTALKSKYPKCDGVTGCLETEEGSAWLAGFLGPILNHTGIFSSSTAQNNVNHTVFIVTYDESGNTPSLYSGYKVKGDTSGNTVSYCNAIPNGVAKGDAVCGGTVPLVVIDHYNKGLGQLKIDASHFSLDAMVEWLFNLSGPKGTGMDNPGHLDWNYRTAYPGFPTLEWLLGVSNDGYPASN
ncbi:MAG: alkaline phosphatase family protein [Thermoplasmata archaeon]